MTSALIPALRISLPARQESLALLRHVVRGFRDAYAVAPARMDDIVLAVSEAATNVVVHAYAHRTGTITVVARVEDERLQILVRDHGRGIVAPADTPKPGHGLALMRHVAISLEVVGSRAGTDVTMSFDLTAEPDRPALADRGTAP